MIDVKEWVKKFGPQYNITSEEVLRQRLGGRPNRGVIYPVPEGWKGFKVGKQWFLEKADEDTQAPKRTISPVRQRLFENAEITPFLIQLLLSAAKEAALSGRTKRVLIDFSSYGSNFETRHVGRVFDATGQEIETAYSSWLQEPADRHTPEYWHIKLHEHWLRCHIVYKTEKDRKDALAEFVERHVPKDIAEEAKRRLMSRCIWCGILKRSKVANKRPQAKFCDEKYCRPPFKSWLKTFINPKKDPHRNALMECPKRIEEIRLALES